MFTASTPAGKIEIGLAAGRFHVYNILAAIAAGLALESRSDDIGPRPLPIANLSGRFEQVIAGRPTTGIHRHRRLRSYRRRTEDMY